MTREEESRLEATEFFSSIHHKAAATILATSFHLLVPRRIISSSPPKSLRRANHPSSHPPTTSIVSGWKTTGRLPRPTFLIPDEIKFGERSFGFISFVDASSPPNSRETVLKMECTDARREKAKWEAISVLVSEEKIVQPRLELHTRRAA